MLSTILFAAVLVVLIVRLANLNSSPIIISKSEPVELPGVLTAFKAEPLPQSIVDGLAGELLGENYSFTGYMGTKHMYVYTNGSWFLEVYEHGSINLYRKMSGGSNPPENLPSQEEARKIAEKIFDRIMHVLSKYMPPLSHYNVTGIAVKPGRTGHVVVGLRLIKVNGTWIEEKVNGSETYIENYMVEFKVGLEGLPATYKDGAMIIIGDRGKSSKITIYMKNIEPWKKIRIAGLDEVKEALKKYFARQADRIIIENISLTYFSQSPIENAEYLKPAFQVSGRIEGKGKPHPYKIILSAEKGRVEVILGQR